MIYLNVFHKQFLDVLKWQIRLIILIKMYQLMFVWNVKVDNIEKYHQQLNILFIHQLLNNWV